MGMRQDDEIEALSHELRQRRWRERAPKKMADVLSELMARRGYAQAETTNERADAWRSAAGEALAAESRPGSVRRGVLEITVRNSSVLQELTFQKKTLLRKMGELVPTHQIRDLRFRVGAID